jgi:hypothetical protein
MMLSSPAIGTLVVSNDGKELGRVKEISGSCFKVDAPMQPDYWLGMGAIRDANQGPIVLTLDASELDANKKDAPGAGHEGWHKHTT